MVLLEFGGGKLQTLETLPVPGARRLVRFHGTLDEVTLHLTSYNNTGYTLPAWVDVEIRSELTQLEVAETLLKIIADLDRKQLEVLTRRHFRLLTLRPLGEDADEPLTRSLNDFTAREVFEQRVEGEPETNRAELLRTFDELLERM